MIYEIPPFKQTLSEHDLKLTRQPIETLQVNVGKRCNQACHHCHVEAGPKRTEMMEERTMERIIRLMKNSPSLKKLDITGGAPELHVVFRPLVQQARLYNLEVIDRCNLTVLFEAGQETTAQFLRDYEVHIIASLPCYSKENVEKQRGSGVFDKSIRALHILNGMGYGREGSSLILDLAYNPIGPSLPPPQQKLEVDYKRELKELFNIQFNHLFTITNMPIKRFLTQLIREGKLLEYMNLLVNSFNAEAACGIMCRNLISIGWDGRIYDCDFNQMLEMPFGDGGRTIWDIESFLELEKEPIAFANHCYGCMAGAGSSCGGSLV